MWLIFSWNHCCHFCTRCKSIAICFCSSDKGLMPILCHQFGWRTRFGQNFTTQVIEVWRCVNKKKRWYVWPQDVMTMSFAMNHSKQIGQALIKITLLSCSSCLQGWTIGVRNVDNQKMHMFKVLLDLFDNQLNLVHSLQSSCNVSLQYFIIFASSLIQRFP